MKLSVGVKLSNSLSLTPQLQQAIKLLQLSNLELQQEIQLQIESNPLLENIEEENFSEQDKKEIESNHDNQLIPDELVIDTHWDDIYIHQSNKENLAEEEREKENSYEESLKENLYQQINLSNFSKIDQLIAYVIVDELDNKGFLKTPISEITASVNSLLDERFIEDVENSEVIAVLKYLHNLEPLGIGSRSLVEYLSIQLNSITDPYKNIALMLLEHQNLLMTNEISKLVKMINISESDFSSGLALIRSLQPYPSLKFDNTEIDYQIPDVVVSRQNNKWHVYLNPDVMPKLRLHPLYSKLIKRADQSEDNQYLKDKMLDAKNFIKSIDERHKTLLKVSSCIVKHQQAFLNSGPEAMKPLILRDIAEEVELHESTISRVTTNKFILTPKGLFELKYFFSSHVGTTQGGECSSTAIRAKIKKIIATENIKKPLSDNAIANLLKSDGIEVARRTVAKYRESLNIPASSERKVLL